MKSLVIILMIIATSFQLIAAEIKISSSIESATIFRQGAEIVRTTNARIPAGSSTVVLESLAGTITPASIQVRVPVSVTLLSATHRLNYLVQHQLTDSYRIMRDSVEVVGMLVQRSQNEIHGLQEEEDLIKKNKSIGGQNSGVDLAELKAIATYARERIREIRDEIIVLQLREKKLKKKLNNLTRQLQSKNANQNRASGEVVLELSTKIPQNADLEITYVVQNAGWSPLYDIRSESISKPAKLIYKASVKQNTGVDWMDVPLTISSGNPSVNQNRPILNPWYVNFMPHAYGISGYKLEDGSLNKTKNLSYTWSHNGNQAAPEPNAGLVEGSISQYVNPQQGQLNVSFDIAIPYDILSDNKQHMVTMKDYEMKTDYQYQVVPKMDKDAFLLAKVTEWEDLNLLPGNANIFFEGTYVGQSYINPGVTSDTLLVSMGRDRRIVVQHEKITDMTSTAFIGLNKKETSAYKITIRNSKNIPIRVEVLDNIPISQNEDIVIKLEEHSGANYVEEYGKLSWTINLAPGESKELDLLYTVKYPKGKVIQ